MLVRALFRRQASSFLVLAVIGGLGLGFAMTAAAGARRTEAAYDRLRAATLAPDALLDATDLDDAGFGRLAAAPEVRAIARFSYTPVAPAPLTPGVNGAAFVGLDRDFLTNVYRPLVLHGRLARRDASDEVVVNEKMAKLGHFRVGQRVRLRSGFEHPTSIGEATIVGVVRGMFDVGANASNASMLLSRAFLEAHRDGIQIGPQPALIVRLAHGESDLAPFERTAGMAEGHAVLAMRASEEAVSTNRTLSVQTIAFELLALVALLATAVAAVQALGRLLSTALVDLPVLVAIGFQPRRRMILGALLALPLAFVGSVVAAGVSAAASPLVPTGFARAVDPRWGFQVDMAVLIGLCLAWTVVIVGAGVLLGWRERPNRLRSERPWRTGRLIRSFPLRARLGCDAALAPVRAPAGPAARSALIASTVAVAGVIAVATFGASLGHLLDDPALQGWNADAAISNGDGGLGALRTSLAGLDHDRAVARVGWVSIVEIQIKGQPIEAYAFDPDGGALHPTMRSGRPPLADNEVALGADTMRAGKVHIGDKLTVAGPRGRVQLRVVGSATYPELGNNGDLANAASLTRHDAVRIGATERGAVALIKLVPGRQASALERYANAGEVVAPFRPARVRNLEQTAATPWILAAFLVALGIAAIAHGLIRSLNLRRRDHAVLACMGMRPRDLRRIITWQATVTATLAVAIGSFAGIIAGRAAWSAAASATGVVDQTVIPTLAIVLALPALLLVCNVIASAGTYLTTKTHPAHDLHTQ